MAIITISRKAGSYGEEIGALVAKKLNYRFVTPEDIHKLAEECDAEFKRACSVFEHEISTGFMERFFFRDPSYLSLFQSLNFELAAAGNVILLGRGAQFVMADYPGVFRVRVVAPFKTRVERVAESKKVSQDEAADYLEHLDRSRRSLIESVFKKDLADWSWYDMLINTTHITAEVGADMISQAVEKITWPASNEEIKQIFTRHAFAKKVESAIKKELPATPYSNIEVTSPGEGEILISGYVQDQASREMAAEVAAKIPGAKSVKNELKTTGLIY